MRTWFYSIWTLIYPIEWMKKSTESKFKKKSIALSEYLKVSDNEPLESILACKSVPVDIEINDLLVEELYSKERGVRVLFFGIQLDEMWTFVQILKSDESKFRLNSEDKINITSTEQKIESTSPPQACMVDKSF